MERRDRLARFGVEHLEAALGAHGRRIVVADSGESTDDLVRDMIEVLTSMCARLYGRAGRPESGPAGGHRHQGRTGTGGVMGGAAKCSELKRAAQILGVTSTTLRQHGWKTASAARIQAVTDDPPDWAIAARENQREKRARQQRRRAFQGTASRLGIQLRAVKERDVRPTDVEGLLAAQPGWLVAEQQRRQAQVEREATDKLCRELADTLITSVHEVWFAGTQARHH